MRLQNYASEIYTCNRSRCGFCEEGCPTYKQSGFEFNASRGRMQIARGLLEGTFAPSEGIIKRAFQCTLCGYCQYRCALNNTKILEAMRTDLAALGLEPNETLTALESTLKEGNPYRKPRSSRNDWARSLSLPTRGKLLYFSGCTASYLDRRLSRNTIALLRKVGVDIAYLGNSEPCCGSFVHMIGHPDEFTELVGSNLRLLKESECRTIITSCAGCYETLKQAYSEISGAGDFEILHTVEYIGHLVDSDKIHLRSPVRGAVTYHDPCHLGRSMGIFEPPRRILSNMRGLEYVEMKNSKLDSSCCGGGGGLLASYPDLSLSIARKRVSEAEKAGARYLISACSTCDHTLGRSRKYANSEVKVEDIMTLVLAAVSS